MGSVDIKTQVISMGLNSFKNRLIQFQNSIPAMQEEVASEIAKELDPKIKEIVEEAVNRFDEGRPSNAMYVPTGNIKNINGEVINYGPEIFAMVHNNGMSSYPGFPWGYPLAADRAFEFMFIAGEHGHGRYNKGNTNPSPDQIVAKKAEAFQPEINAAVRKVILAKLGL